MVDRTWPTLLAALLRGEELSTDDTAWAMGEIMSGRASPVRIAGFVTALRAKGETPAEIAEAALAPRWLNVTLGSPNADRSWFLQLVSAGPIDMATFSRPQQELGGLFLDVQAHRSRSLTNRNTVGIDLHSADDGRTVSVQVPEGARVTNASWKSGWLVPSASSARRPNVPIEAYAS